MRNKKEGGLTIKIHLSNRWLYTFIILGILIIVAVGVYAYGTNNPETFGHSAGELNFSQAIIGNITATGKISAPTFCLNGDCKTAWPGKTDVIVLTQELVQGNLNQDRDNWCTFVLGAGWHVCSWDELDNADTCLQTDLNSLKPCGSISIWNNDGSNTCSNWASASTSVKGGLSNLEICGRQYRCWIKKAAASCNDYHYISCCR